MSAFVRFSRVEIQSVSGAHTKQRLSLALWIPVPAEWDFSLQSCGSLPVDIAAANDLSTVFDCDTHDENVEADLNGAKMWSEFTRSSDQKKVELPPPAPACLRVRRNVLAVHCYQATGGLMSVSVSQPFLDQSDHDFLLDGPKG